MACAGQGAPQAAESAVPEDMAAVAAADSECRYEAEEAVCSNLRRYARTEDGGFVEADDGGYVGLWEDSACSLTFHVRAPADGMYELDFLAAADKAESYDTVRVNERTLYEALHIAASTPGSATIKARLNEGGNTVSVFAGWGWFYLDRLSVRPGKGISDDIYRSEFRLSNNNASANARRLMRYLAGEYGVRTLSGQYASEGGIDSPEVRAIHTLTGKYPAILGFDLMDYSPSRVMRGAETKQVDDALAWANRGGIVALIWHWNAPKDLVDSAGQPWWRGFYAEATTFDLDAALNGRDPAGYRLILRDLDAIAEALKPLAAADVPVLWRPLHEASGGWFWWGAYGPDNYIALWRLMYERFTLTHALDNLLWVYNGQDAAWYPGDAYVDLIGEDVYTAPRDYESHYNRFERALSYTDAPKIIGLSENGAIPDPELLAADNARWSFFITWCERYAVDTESGAISDVYNDLAHWKKVYEDEAVVTLDELPRRAFYLSG